MSDEIEIREATVVSDSDALDAIWSDLIQQCHVRWCDTSERYKALLPLTGRGLAEYRVFISVVKIKDIDNKEKE